MAKDLFTDMTSKFQIQLICIKIKMCILFMPIVYTLTNSIMLKVQYFYLSLNKETAIQLMRTYITNFSLNFHSGTITHRKKTCQTNVSATRISLVYTVFSISYTGYQLFQCYPMIILCIQFPLVLPSQHVPIPHLL